MNQTLSSTEHRDQKTPWLHVILAALPALIHALIFMGRIHPDEVFQSLEIGLFKAYNFGIVAWEWQVPAEELKATTVWGIRSHAVPLLMSTIFKAASAFGIDSVMGRRIAIAIPQFALHGAMLAAIFRYALRRSNDKIALTCMWLMALYAPVMWFGCRTLSESFSTAFLVWGLERLDDERASKYQWLLGGFLFGVSVVTRFPAAALVAGCMLWLLLARKWGPFFWATISGVLVAVALGYLDKITWGDWFHSFINYVKFNVTSGESANRFGASEWYFYFLRFCILPAGGFGLAILSYKIRTRMWILVFPALFYFAIISVTAHKEVRFLYSTLVLLSIAGTVPFATWALDSKSNLKRIFAGALVLSSLSYSVFSCPFAPERPEQFQLTVKAAKDATGFMVMNEGVWGSGGYFYLGKNIPFCTCDFPQEQCFQVAAQNAQFNRAVLYLSPTEEPRYSESVNAFLNAGFRIEERKGLAILFAR
jgi:GPI mannosyltransferase 3